MRRFFHNQNEVDAVQVAAKDTDEFVVEKIISHVGDIRHKSTLRFKVQWAGYDEPTLEPFENLKDVGVFHDYLKHVGAQSLIPVRYR
jgi:hypothetical protein